MRKMKLTDKFVRVTDRFSQHTYIKRVGKIMLLPEGCEITACGRNCKKKLWFSDADEQSKAYWCVKKAKSAREEDYLLEKL